MTFVLARARTFLAAAATVAAGLLPYVVMAQVQGPDAQIAQDFNLAAPSTDLRGIIVTVVQWALGFLGLVAVVVMMYGGFLWMTARGNEEQIRRAKRVLVNALIGLIIILSSWAIVAFVVRSVGDALDPRQACQAGDPDQSRSTPCSQTRSCQDDGSGNYYWSSWGPVCPGPLQIFQVRRVSPPHQFFYPPGAPKNTKIKVEFTNEVDITTLPPAAATNFEVWDIGTLTGVPSSPVFVPAATPTAVPGTVTLLPGNRRLEFIPSGFCPPPNDTVPCFTEYHRYEIRIASGLSGVKSIGGSTLTCTAATCSAQFDTNDQVDTTPPQAAIERPDQNVVDDNAALVYSARGRDAGGVSDVCLLGKKLVCSGNNAVDCRQDAECAAASIGTCVDQGTDVALPGGVPQCFSPASASEYQNFLGQTSWNASGQAGKAFALRADVDDFGGNSTSVKKCVYVRPNHCLNGTQDATETGIDCGGDPVALGDDYCGACSGDRCNAGVAPSVCANYRDLSCSVGNACDATSNTCVPLPVISDFQLRTGTRGNYITITGRGFGATQGAGKVTFLGAAASGDDRDASLPSVAACPAGSSWSDRQIIVEVPNGFVDGPIRVENNAGLTDDTSITSPPGLVEDFKEDGVFRPGLACLSPTAACFDDTLSAYGKNIDATSELHFGSVASLPTTFTSPDTLAAKVPNLQASNVSVRAKRGAEFSNPLVFTVNSCNLPRIDSVTPASGPTQQTITIAGAHFGRSTGEVRIINNVSGVSTTFTPSFPPQCSNLALWSDTQIVTRIPQGLSVGGYTLQLKRAGDGATTPAVNPAAAFSVNTNPATPLLCLLNPNRGPVGTAVEIVGEGFGNTQSSSRAVFSANVSPTAAATCAALLRKDFPGRGKQCASQNCPGDGGNGDGYVSGDELDEMQRLVGVANCGGTCPAGYDPNGNNAVEQSEVSSVVSSMGSTCAGTWSNTKVKAAVPSGAITGPALIQMSSAYACAKNLATSCTGPSDASCAANGPCVPKDTSNPINFTVGACSNANDCSAGYDCCAGDGACRLTGSCPDAVPQPVSSYRWRFTAGNPAPRVDEQRTCSFGDLVKNGSFEIPGATPTTAKDWTFTGGTVVSSGGFVGRVYTSTASETIEQTIDYGLPVGGLRAAAQLFVKHPLAAGDVTVALMDGATTLGSQTTPAPSSGSWIAVPFLFPLNASATATTFKLVITLPTNAEVNDVSLELSPGSQSPSPWKSSQDACTNARVSVRFTEDLSATTCSDPAAITLYECDDEECEPADRTIVSTMVAAGCTTPRTLEYNPGPLTAGRWYLGQVHATKILSNAIPPARMGQDNSRDYYWKFKVGTGPCAVYSTQCSPKTTRIQTLQSPGNQATLFADLQAQNCNLLVCDSSNAANWSIASANPPGNISLPPGPTCVNNVTALAEGTSVVSVVSRAGGKAGMCSVYVQIPPLKVTDYYPNCEKACTNALVGADFNVQVDPATVTYGATRSVRLYDCGTDADATPLSSCTLVNATVTIVPDSPKTGQSRVQIIPSSALPASRYFRVRLMDTIKTADGKTMDELNYVDGNGNSFSWVFATGTKSCDVERLVTTPDSVEVRTIGAVANFTTQPWSASDECSQTGQRLNPYLSDYKWYSSQSQVGTVTQSNNIQFGECADGSKRMCITGSDQCGKDTNGNDILCGAAPFTPFVDPVQSVTAVGTHQSCQLAPFMCSTDITSQTPPAVMTSATALGPLDDVRAQPPSQFRLRCGFTAAGSCDSGQQKSIASVKGFCKAVQPSDRRECGSDSDCSDLSVSCVKPDTNCDGKLSGADLIALNTRITAGGGLQPSECQGLDVNGALAGAGAITSADRDKLYEIFRREFGAFPTLACSNGGGSVRFSALESVATSGGGYGIATDTDGKRVFLVARAAGVHKVDIIDTKTHQVTASVSAPGADLGDIVVHPDGSRAFVANANPAGSGSVMVFDAGQNRFEGAGIQLCASAPCGTPSRLALSRDGSLLYVTVTSPDKIVVIDTASRAIRKTITDALVASPRGIVLAKKGNGDAFYVATVVSGTPHLIEIDPSSGDSVSDKGTNTFTMLDLAASPDGTHVYAAGQSFVVYYDVQSGSFSSQRGSVNGLATTVVASRDGKYVFAAEEWADLYVFDAATMALVSKFNLSPLANTQYLTVATAGAHTAYFPQARFGQMHVVEEVGMCSTNVDCAGTGANQCGNGVPTGTCLASGVCSNDPQLPCLDSDGVPQNNNCRLAINAAGCCGAQPWVESVSGAEDDNGRLCRNAAFEVTFSTLMDEQSVRAAVRLERSDSNDNCADAIASGRSWWQRAWNFIVRLFAGEASASHTTGTGGFDCSVEADVAVRTLSDGLGNPIKTQAIVSPRALLSGPVDANNDGTISPAEMTSASNTHYRLRIIGGPSGAKSLNGIPLFGTPAGSGVSFPYTDTTNTATDHPIVGDRICAIARVEVAIDPGLDHVQQKANPRTPERPYDVYNCHGDNCRCVSGVGDACRLVDPVTSTYEQEDQNTVIAGNQHLYRATAKTANGGLLVTRYRWLETNSEGASIDPQQLLTVMTPDQDTTHITLSSPQPKNGFANVRVVAASGWRCADASGNPTATMCADDADCTGGLTCQGEGVLRKDATVPVTVFICKQPWRSPATGAGFQENNQNFMTTYCRDDGKSLLPTLNIVPTPGAAQTPRGELLAQWLLPRTNSCAHNKELDAVAGCTHVACGGSVDCSFDQNKDGFVDQMDVFVASDPAAVNGFIGTNGVAGQSVPHPDAIGIRVYQNGRHLTPTQWYETQPTPQGNPQSTTVDGYPAVADGSTVYIGAGNAVTVATAPTRRLYTNIYVLSYGQGDKTLGQATSPSTVKIFNRLLQNLVFNTNILGGGACIEPGTGTQRRTCDNNPDRSCTVDSDCEDNGVCVTTACVFDSDCPANFACDSQKQKVTRDVKRVSNLLDIGNALEAYRFGSRCATVTRGAPGDADCNGVIEAYDVTRVRSDQGTSPTTCRGGDVDLSGGVITPADVASVISKVDESCSRSTTETTNYPALSAGTYVQGTTTSRWPSWAETFSSALKSDIAVDPLNFFGSCSGYGTDGTCWSDPKKQYACYEPDPAGPPMNSCENPAHPYPPAVPKGSHVYTYTAFGVCQRNPGQLCLFDSDCPTNTGPCLRGAEYALCSFQESCYNPYPATVGSTLSANRYCQYSANNIVTSGLIDPPIAHACNLFSLGILPPPVAGTPRNLSVTVVGNAGESVSDPVLGLTCAAGNTCPRNNIVDGTFVRLLAAPLATRSVRWENCDRVVSAGTTKFCEITLLSDRLDIRAVFSDPPPRITSFSMASPSTIPLGQKATLSWSIVAQGATTVRLLGNGQAVPNCGSLTAGSTSCVVQPIGTTSYQLEVANAAGRVTRSYVVYVNSTPNVRNIPDAVDVWKPGTQYYVLGIPERNACFSRTYDAVIGSTRVRMTCSPNGILFAETAAAGSTYYIEDSADSTIRSTTESIN